MLVNDVSLVELRIGRLWFMSSPPNHMKLTLAQLLSCNAVDYTNANIMNLGATRKHQIIN